MLSNFMISVLRRGGPLWPPANHRGHGTRSVLQTVRGQARGPAPTIGQGQHLQRDFAKPSFHCQSSAILRVEPSMSSLKQWRKTEPYDQQFLFVVTADFAGKSLLEFYTTKFKYKTPEYWHSLIAQGLVNLNHLPTSPDTVLTIGDEIRTKRLDVTEPDVNAQIEILYEEQGLFVLNKKAPMPVHPSGRYFKNSLTTVLRELYPEKTFHTIHRLDKWTTGVLILATDSKVARHMHLQVEKQRIEKTYGVLGVGAFPKTQFLVDEAIGRIDGVYRGTGDFVRNPKSSQTEFQVMHSHPTQTNLHLLKATPLTGRTNQIRVHMQTAGGYVLYDPLYSPMQQADDALIPFLGLHCREMKFLLPDGKPLSIQAPWPEPFLELFPKIAF